MSWRWWTDMQTPGCHHCHSQQVALVPMWCQGVGESLLWPWGVFCIGWIDGCNFDYPCYLTVLVLTYAAKSACLVIPLFIALAVLSFRVLRKLTSAKTRNTVLIWVCRAHVGWKDVQMGWGTSVGLWMAHGNISFIASWFPGTDKHHAMVYCYCIYSLCSISIVNLFKACRISFTDWI